MDPIQVYAIVNGGIFCVLLLLNSQPWIVHIVRYLYRQISKLLIRCYLLCRAWIVRIIQSIYLLISKHLVHRYVLHRHRLVGPWSLAGVLLQLIYIAGNISCFSLGGSHVETQASTLSRAGLRAGTLSVINLIPLFASPHLDSLADILGVTLTTVRQIHRSVGLMAVLLTVFHVIVSVITRPSFTLSLAQNQLAVIVSVQLSTSSLRSRL